jgi:undecaprenyl-diphosphatase
LSSEEKMHSLSWLLRFYSFTKDRVMDLFEGLDWGTYYFFRFQANHAPDWVNRLMGIGDLMGSYVAAAVLLTLAVAATPPRWRRRMAFAVVAGFLFGGLLIEGVKLATWRVRPPDAQNVFGTAEMSPSFPSRAVFLAAFAWMMLGFALERRIAPQPRVAVYVVAALGIVFVCVSELWLGLHFVTDVLAGMAGGIGLALTTRWAATDERMTNS